MSTSKVTVRPREEQDLEPLNTIYNQYVIDTHFTFDLEPMKPEARREWFSHYSASGRHRLLVAVSDGAVVGFACSSRFRPKAAYETSVETTIYLAAEVVGRGAGSKLYGELFQALEGEDVHRAYARDLAAKPGIDSAAREFRLQKNRPFHRAGAQVWTLLGCRLVREAHQQRAPDYLWESIGRERG